MRNHDRLSCTLTRRVVVLPCRYPPKLFPHFQSHRSSAKITATHWYVSAAAIHRVSRKPLSVFRTFGGLSLDTAESEGQLSAIEVGSSENRADVRDALSQEAKFSSGALAQALRNQLGEQLFSIEFLALSDHLSRTGRRNERQV